MARPTITLAEAYAQYVHSRRLMAADTNRTVNRKVRHFVDAMGPDKQVGTLTAEKIEAYFLTGPKARADAVSAASFNNEVQNITGFIKFGLERHWFEPLLMARVRNQKVPKKLRLKLGANQMLECLDIQYHPRDRFIVAMGINVGLRASEVAFMRIKHVDLRNTRMDVWRQKQGIWDRLIINPDLGVEVRRWLTWYQSKVGVLEDEMRLVPARSPNRFVKGENGKSVLAVSEEIRPYASSLQYIRKPVHRALEHLGLPTNGEGLHTLRRSAAQAFYDKCSRDHPNEDATRLTQAFFQHSSLAVTERYLGMTRMTRVRDQIMSEPFLSSMVSDENVVQLRPAVNGGYDLNSYLKENR